ncbi:sensor histidine kinase [Taibaiella helva]|uniref:sensor histidine kinase n=1 Tax=Taibaiella helva TaxID=2301235 RepID=UPI0018E59789|nr:HAMP domain-containing sensor histidine kinase [Taibaiella helva]
MMSTGKQGRRLRAIGLLMLAGALLLLLFLGEWLRTQYNSQQRRLDQEVKMTFALAEAKMNDSLFKHTLSFIINADDSARSNTHMRMIMSSPASPAGAADSAPLYTTIRITHDVQTTQTNGKLPAPADIRPKNNRMGMSGLPRTVSERHISLPDVPGTRAEREVMGQLIRMALTQKFNATTIKTRADSAFWLRTFQEALNEKQRGLLVHWDTALAASAQFFHYGPADSLEVPFMVTGYKPVLIKSIAPQAAFSLLLLVLICAAFALAYRTMQRQAQFNRQKDSFIGNISHELKTPVATTRVALEALTTYQGMEDPERARKYLNVAHWEMNRLSILIDRIMNAIQAQHGKIQLVQEALQPALLVEELVQTLQPVFAEKKVAVSWEAGNSEVRVMADKVHLQGAIYNLIDNALKYGGDRIQLRQTVHGDRLQLSVADNGPGIPAAYRHKVFESFFRVPTGNQHNVKGHGLGLSYAYDIIAAHQGSLSLESPAGGGVVFLITLPIQPVS